VLEFLPVLDRIKTLVAGGLTLMHVVGDFLKRRIAPLQRRARLCCWFTGPNDIDRIQRGPGTDLSWEELELLVKGITGESFVPESLILPQGIPALCDDLGLRTVILATLPTLDESGVVVRHTGDRDPHRGIRISNAPAGGPQPTGVAPSAPATAPRPLDKGKGAASSSSAPGGTGGSEEERRHRLRRVDGSFVSNPPRSVRGLLVGPRRPTSRPKARRGASVLCHHHHRVRRHHNHHHHRSNRHHHHLGMISPRGTSSSNNNSSSKSSGRPASRVAGKSRAPSECTLFPLVYLLCRRVLTHPLLVRASSPSAPKVVPPPPNTMSGGLALSSRRLLGVVPTIRPRLLQLRRQLLQPQRPRCRQVHRRQRQRGSQLRPPLPSRVTRGRSSIPPPTLEEPEVVFGRRLRSGAELEAAPVPLPQVLPRAHRALHETEAVILREWEALEVEHQRLSDWRTQLEDRTKAASRQFASERSELERDHKDYKKDLQKVYAQELEARRKEKRLAKREEALSQREAVVTELRAKLSAMDKILEEQRIQQVEAIEKIKKWERELEDKASNIALTEENLKEKDVSLDRREADLSYREKDLAFREEMLERRDKLLAEHELEAEEKEWKLEEQVRQFQAAQTAPGPQAVEATRKALEDLQTEHRAGVQRIAA
jgi:hypothetical protein